MTREDANDVNRRHAVSPLVRAIACLAVDDIAMDDIAVMAGVVIVHRQGVLSGY
jgi:hypothetical protein